MRMVVKMSVCDEIVNNPRLGFFTLPAMLKDFVVYTIRTL